MELHSHTGCLGVYSYKFLLHYIRLERLNRHFTLTSFGMPEQVALKSDSSSKRKSIGVVVGVCVGVAGAFLVAG